MAPGNHNGHNYGGGHTGSGKKQHTGMYRWGYSLVPQPNRMFQPGVNVYNIKTGDNGVVIQKTKYMSSRGIHKIETLSKIYYERTSNLRILPDSKTSSEKNKTTRTRNKVVKDYTDARQKRNMFRQKKKEINRILKTYQPKNSSSLSQDGSSWQLADWIANRNDFYEFINSTSEQKIHDLFVQNKKTKQRIIHKLVEDFLESYREKNKQSETYSEKLLLDKKKKYLEELHRLSLSELKKKLDWDSVGKEFEIVDEKTIEQEYELV